MSGERIAVHLALLCMAFAACAAPTAATGTRWTVRRAEQLRAEGRFEKALRITDREIGWTSPSPGPDLVALHIALLREVGRMVEADAYDSFTRRYFAGEDMDRAESSSPERGCSERQPELRLIRSWARPEQGAWEIGPIVATFEIDARGSIDAIEIHRARDPASAWGAIDSIARAKVRVERVTELYAEASERFPISLCLSRNFDPRQDPIPDGLSIRGSD